MNDPSPEDPLGPERSGWAAALLAQESPLGARFAAAVATTRKRYPELDLPLAPFANRVAALLESKADLESSLGELRLDDLYLAHGCALGWPKALALFEAAYLRPLRTFIREFDSSEPQLDELKQLVREHLLLGAPGRPARITKYSGRGSLETWVRVAARRLAFSTLRRHLPEAPASDAALMDHVAPDPGPELFHLQSSHAAEFREALSAALAQLTTRERLLLRLHLVQGVSLTRIAVTYRVSQSTVSRWFSQIRDQVRNDTKLRLRQLLSLTSAEFDSLARLLQSGLDVSLSQLLRSSADSALKEPDPAPRGRS